MNDDRTADVVVTGEGRELRRQVGPNAWAVLEELAGRAVPDADRGPTVDVPLGRVAHAVGLSSDVVRGALRRLAKAGIVEREEVRSADTQRFAGARYRIVRDTGLVAVPPVSHAEEPGAAIPVAGSPGAEEPQLDSRDGVARAAGRRQTTSGRARAKTDSHDAGQLDLLGSAISSDHPIKQSQLHDATTSQSSTTSAITEPHPSR